MIFLFFLGKKDDVTLTSELGTFGIHIGSWLLNRITIEVNRIDENALYATLYSKKRVMKNLSDQSENLSITNHNLPVSLVSHFFWFNLQISFQKVTQNTSFRIKKITPFKHYTFSYVCLIWNIIYNNNSTCKHVLLFYILCTFAIILIR